MRLALAASIVSLAAASASTPDDWSKTLPIVSIVGYTSGAATVLWLGLTYPRRAWVLPLIAAAIWTGGQLRVEFASSPGHWDALITPPYMALWIVGALIGAATSRARRARSTSNAA